MAERLETAPLRYFKMVGAPGDYFHCAPYGATMRVASCASLYQAEKGCKTGRHLHCNGCSIGARHAGEAPVVNHALFGAKFCPRCSRTAMRIVRGLCVSCINRQYEIEKGRNAKGTPPIRLPPLYPVALAVLAEGQETRIVKYDRVVSRVEGIYRVLRSQPGDMAFGWVGRKPALAQPGLF